MRLTLSSGWAVPAHSMAMSHGVGGAPARHEVCRVAYHKEEPGRSGVHVCAEAKRAVCASSFDHVQRRREQRSRGHAHLARRSRGIQVCMHAQRRRERCVLPVSIAPLWIAPTSACPFLLPSSRHRGASCIGGHRSTWEVRGMYTWTCTSCMSIMSHVRMTRMNGDRH